MTSPSLYEHKLMYGVAIAGEEGVTFDALLSEGATSQSGGSNAALRYITEKHGLSERAAVARYNKDTRLAWREYGENLIAELVKKGRLLEKDGRLFLGRMPRGYEPFAFEQEAKESMERVNLSMARKAKGGWSYWVQPELHQDTVARMADSMLRVGWPKDSTILLDADGELADGKHHLAAAEAAGIEVPKEAFVQVEDEIALWEMVKDRNINRWPTSKSESAKLNAKFIALRPSLTLGEKQDLLRERLASVSERTQQRATKEAREQIRAAQAEVVKKEAAKGASDREAAEKAGVSRATAQRMKGEAAQSRQSGGDEQPPPPKTIGICCVCMTEIKEGEKYGHPLVIRDGYRIFTPARKGAGGPNAIWGEGAYSIDREQMVHQDCTSANNQLAYRGRARQEGVA